MENFTNAQMLNLPLADIERMLDDYLKIAEVLEWDIDPKFENELKLLTLIAKEKGSTRRW